MNCPESGCFTFQFLPISRQEQNGRVIRFAERWAGEGLVCVPEGGVTMVECAISTRIYIYIYIYIYILSRNHLPHQVNQPPTPAHNHQSTNHEHLQSLTTTIQKLTHLSHSSAGLKVASYSMLVDAYLSARPSWNSSLPVETQVYIQLELFILLPVHPSLSLLCWKPSLGYIE